MVGTLLYQHFLHVYNHAPLFSPQTTSTVPLQQRLLIPRPPTMLPRQVEERPKCGSDGEPDDYNTGLQVFGLFLLLVVGTLATAFPSIMRRFPNVKIPMLALFISRHFGTGVILATAFCHLLTTAYKKLSDPCLPPFWTETYPAIPGFIAMISVMVLVAIEMAFVTRGLKHCHALEIGERECDPCVDAEQGAARRATSSQPHPSDQKAMQFAKPSSESSSLSKQRSAPCCDSIRPCEPTTNDDDSCCPQPTTTASHPPPTPNPSGTTTTTTSNPASQTHERRQILQCLLLELSILFHTIFIGISLAFSSGRTWVVLITAISFHQTFEGLAVGSRIANIPSFFKPRSAKPWILSLGYGVTAPMGIAVGLGVRGHYDPDGEEGLVLVGVFNAISAGLLLYVGLVQLLGEDLVCERSYASLRGWRRLVACFAVVAGALLMALMAVWV